MRHTMLVLTLLASLVPIAVRAQSTRTVTYNSHIVVSVNTKLRFTTLIILPESEEILDFVCGDRDFWVISGARNLAYVKPAKAGAATNLNLVTASGHVYSFVLTEASGDPDLKLYVEADETVVTAGSDTPRLYTAAQVEQFKQAAADSQREAAAAKEAATKHLDDAVRAFRATYPTTLEFPYVLKGNGPPFNVSAIYHDDHFTYIKAAAAELPAIYEVLDDAPSLVPFQVEHGVYVIPRILDRGYLTIGRKKLTFERAK